MTYTNTPPTDSLVARFLSRAIPGDLPDDCWDWIGHKNPKGYAQFSLFGTIQITSRVSYLLFRGDLPDGMCVLHTCDNPSCTNPAHLFLGTVAENNADRDNKGRTVPHVGEGHPCSKLTESDVFSIRSRLVSGELRSGIASEYGVHKTTIALIENRKTWKHLARLDTIRGGS